MQITDAPKVATNESVTMCDYYTPAFDSVTVRFQTGEDPAGFAEGKKSFAGSPITDLTGFEDEAYTNTVADINTLVARKGSVEIEVVSKAPIDREKTLEAQLFAALR